MVFDKNEMESMEYKYSKNLGTSACKLSFSCAFLWLDTEAASPINSSPVILKSWIPISQVLGFW